MRIGDRFEIEQEAGAGGMAIVYRALDRTTGKRVALKRLNHQSPDAAARFVREARALAALTHPAIVRHVAHGVGDDGRLWLAMEWLDGEDLASRLRAGRLSLVESLAIARTAADALAEAHAAGLVHRDLKPANMFLVGGATSQLKILDFGIARLALADVTPTATGAMLGTPAYMAPEQARGERDVDARADVFSLGCVLFECLTGQPAFSGTHVMAVLARILLDDAPQLSSIVDGVPHALDALCARMLARDRRERPESAAALVAEIDMLGPIGATTSLVTSRPRGSLSDVEQRRVLVAICAPSSGDTLRAATDDTVPTIDNDPFRAHESPWASDAGARFEHLAGGMGIALFSGLASATDLAVRAARSALWMRARFPDAAVFVTTGQAIVGSRELVGDVIERAVVAVRVTPAWTTPGARPVDLDAAVAPLLDARFDVRAGASGPELWGEHVDEGRSRSPSIRPASICVGRERELNALLAWMDDALTERVGLVCLVTGAPGMGKTRLREELVERIAERADSPRIWAVRADSMEAGSALAVAARIVWCATGVAPSAPVATRRHRLATHARALLGEDDGARVAEMLGEVLGAPAELESLPLRAARESPALLREQVMRAFRDLVVAEVRRAPLVVLVEDLHWADVGTLKLLDAALADAAELPLFVVGFARPDLHEVAPRLWAERGVQEIKLAPLSRRACETLAAHVLGETATPEDVAAIAARAGGMPFLVEELARARTSASDALPESVLAVLQIRLERSSPEARRVLRAASVLGERFWKSGVATMLGVEPVGAIDAWLAELARDGLIDERRGDDVRFRDQIELCFRHALVRDAAIATLTEEDLAIAHAIAGEWLEGAGETDRLVLARHFERGGAPLRAAAHYTRAAEQALASDALDDTVRNAERALTLGAEGPVRVAALLALAAAFRWIGDGPKMAEVALRARSETEPGAPAWYEALSLAAVAGSLRDDVDLIARCADELTGATPAEPGPALNALSRACTSAMLCQQRDAGRRLLDRAEALLQDSSDVPGILLDARGWVLRAEGRSEEGRDVHLAAARRLAAEGARRSAAIARINAAWGLVELGRADEGIAELEALGAEDLDASGWTTALLAEGHRREGQLAAAERLACTCSADEKLAIAVRVLSALEAGALDRAFELDVQLGPSERSRSAWAPIAFEARVRALHARGDPSAAVVAAEAMRPSGGFGALDDELGPDLAYAEALAAAGRSGEASHVLRSVLDRIAIVLAHTKRPENRRSLLTRHREVVRARGLAHAWLARDPFAHEHDTLRDSR